MFKKLAAFFATPLLLLATASNTFATTEIMSISNIAIKEKSENTTSTTVSFEGNNINTDAILTRRNSFISYEITLKNNSKQKYKITDIEDDISGDTIKSSYDFESDFIESNKTINIVASYTYQTEQDSDSNEPIALDDIAITLTLVDENDNTITNSTDRSETSSTNPFTGDHIVAFIAIFASSIAALLCLFKKHPKIAASLACLACTIAIGAVFTTSTNAAEAKTVKLYIHSLSIMPKAAPHVVHFDANNGLGDMEPQNFELDTPQSLTANAFTRNYFDFAEWNTEPDGSGESYTDGAELNFTESGETTLYAQWTTNHKVAFLDTGRTINAKIKRLAGLTINENTSLFNTRVSNIYYVNKGEALPDGFDTEDDAHIISTPESPYKIYVWKNGYYVYIYSEADVIKGNKDMTETFVNFYTADGYSGIADWDMSETENFSSMFAVNNSKGNYTELSNWDTSSATTLYRMFYRNFRMYGLDGLAKWNTSKVTNLSLTFYWTSISSNALNNLTTTDRGDYTSWDVSNVTNLNYTFGAETSSWFTDLNGIGNWNTSKVTTMNSTFDGSDYLKDLSALAPTDRGDYTSWDVSNVTNMTSIFGYCKYLKTLHGLEDWDVSNVTNFAKAFDTAEWLVDISALENWDVSSATTMAGMFSNTKALEDISPLANWDISNVEDLSSFFYYAPKISDITPLAKWNTSKVKTLSGMFMSTAITNVDALATTQRDGYVSWDVSNVTDFSRTFYEVPTLTDINGIVNWNVSKARYMDRTFNGDSGLTYVRMLDAWQPPADVSCIYVFHGTGTNNWPAWAD